MFSVRRPVGLVGVPLHSRGMCQASAFELWGDYCWNEGDATVFVIASTPPSRSRAVGCVLWCRRQASAPANRYAIIAASVCRSTANCRERSDSCLCVLFADAMTVFVNFDKGILSTIAMRLVGMSLMCP